MGSVSPTRSRRTRIARFFVSTESSVISPIPRSLVLRKVRALSARTTSFEPRRRLRTAAVTMSRSATTRPLQTLQPALRAYVRAFPCSCRMSPWRYLVARFLTLAEQHIRDLAGDLAGNLGEIRLLTLCARRRGAGQCRQARRHARGKTGSDFGAVLLDDLLHALAKRLARVFLLTIFMTAPPTAVCRGHPAAYESQRSTSHANEALITSSIDGSPAPADERRTWRRVSSRPRADCSSA